MPPIGDPEERALVIKAILVCPGNCFYWRDAETERRVRAQLNGLRPGIVRQRTVEHVRLDPRCVKQSVEDREPHRDFYDYKYKVVIPDEEFRHGIYVEIVLEDGDHDFPAAVLVNAHPQLR